MLATPKSLEAEHDELMGTLRQASSLEDETGRAVSELMKHLEPHFEKEEKVAMPLLGTLADLVSGEKISNLRDIAESQKPLLQEYEGMFQEHKLLGKFIERAKNEAQRENHQEIVEILEALAHHAKVEEEVLYPAALLAGTLARVMLNNEAQPIIV